MTHHSRETPHLTKVEPCIAKNFGYHEPIVTEGAIESGIEKKVLPLNGSTEPYEFIFESEDEFLCMNNLCMYLKCKIERSDGRDIPAFTKKDSRVSVVNNTLHSIWSDIETRVNNVPINPSSAYNIPYKSFLENVLSMEDGESNFLSCSNWAMDSPELGDTNKSANAGFRKREAFIRRGNSYTFDMTGPICADFLRADNYLAPGNRLTLRFNRASSAFTILTDGVEQYDIAILDFYILANYVTLYDNINIIKPTEKQRYAFSYTEVKEYPLSVGVQQWKSSLITSSNLPKQMIFGFVATEAQVGSQKRNPFYFQHFNIKNIAVQVNGMRFPQESLKPDFGKGLFMREYNHLLMNTGKFRVNHGNSISPELFENGLTLFAMDFSPDLCHRFHRHAGKTGSLELDLQWKNALTEGVTIIVFSIYDNVLELEQSGGFPHINTI